MIRKYDLNSPGPAAPVDALDVRGADFTDYDKSGLERAMLRFRRMTSLQKFVAVHSTIYNHFNGERALHSRDNFKANVPTLSPSGVNSVQPDAEQVWANRDWFAFVRQHRHLPSQSVLPSRLLPEFPIFL